MGPARGHVLTAGLAGFRQWSTYRRLLWSTYYTWELQQGGKDLPTMYHASWRCRQWLKLYAGIGFGGITEGGITSNITTAGRPSPHGTFLQLENGNISSAFERPAPRCIDNNGTGLVDHLDTNIPARSAQSSGHNSTYHANGSVVSRSGGSLDLNAFGWERNWWIFCNATSFALFPSPSRLSSSSSDIDRSPW